MEEIKTAVLKERVSDALVLLNPCKACPRECDINRLDNQVGVCKSGRYATVSSYFPHFGEEDCLRGRYGSGTIFFSHCNLKCVFCQNFDISQQGTGSEVSPQQLAGMMIVLQERGCHNINFVTPEHVVPQIIEALPIAIEEGLTIPLVYNTSAFDSLDSLKLLDGLIDIYMPDFKIWDREKSGEYLKAVNYPEDARAAIKEMHRQVGDLQCDDKGIAKRGLLVRHLVMPGMEDDRQHIFNFLFSDISPDTFVNIMDQYRPAYQVGNQSYSDINRSTSSREFIQAVGSARAVGLHRF